MLICQVAIVVDKSLLVYVCIWCSLPALSSDSCFISLTKSYAQA